MSEYKECPYCGEQILAKAVKCKHCKSLLVASTPVHEEGLAAESTNANASRAQAQEAVEEQPFVQPPPPPEAAAPAPGQAGAPQASTGLPFGQSGAGATQTGLERNVAGLLCYVLGWLTGIIFFVIEKDPFVRFHAMQSIITFGGITVLTILFSVLSVGLWRLWFILHTLNTLIWLASFVLWILLMIKAYQGERFKLPVVGNMAERYV